MTLLKAFFMILVLLKEEVKSSLLQNPCDDETVGPYSIDDEREIVRFATNFYEDSNFQESVKCFTKAIGINPLNMLYYRHRGYCYMRLNDFEKAVEDFKRTSKILPNNSLLCKALLCAEKFEQASEIMGSLGADSIDVMQNELVQRGQFRAALYCLDELIRRDSVNKEYYRKRAEVNRKLENFEAAISDFETVLLLYPRESAAHVSLAKTFVDIDAIDEALQEIHLVDDGSNQALLDLGHYCLSEKRLEFTLSCCNDAFKRIPNWSKAYNLRGLYHLEIREFHLAVDDFKNAIAGAPEVKYRYHLIEALLHAERFSEATKEMKDLPLQNLLILSDYFFGRDQLKYGLHCCTNVEGQQIEKPTSEIWNLLAQCNLRMNRLNAAMVCFEESLRINGAQNKVWLEYAGLCLELGKIEAADNALTQIVYGNLGGGKRSQYMELTEKVKMMRDEKRSKGSRIQRKINQLKERIYG